MSSKADEKRQSQQKSKTWVQSSWVLLFMINIYAVVLATTLSIHKKHKRYSLQNHPYHGARLHTQRKKVTSDQKVRQPHTPVEQQGVTHIPMKDNQLDLTVGQQITEILLNNIPMSQEKRLQFKPGTLNLTQAETLSYCYADPVVYKHHFHKRSRRSIPISSQLKLVFVMIAKSGSSTGRWVMNNILDANETKVDRDLEALSPGGKYEDFSVIAFVRDPLSRFYSSYDEVFYRYGPWMKEPETNGRYGSWAKHVQEFDHPYANMYENMTTYQDFQDAFCPPKFIPKGEILKKAFPRRINWCTYQQTRENGTLAATFERFVFEYDILTPWDVHLSLQVPMLSNKKTGHPVRVNEVFSTETAATNWEQIVSRYGKTLPDDDENLNGRALPRRFNPNLVSIEAKRRICQFAAIDYCCLNIKLPTECSDKGVDISCALDTDEQGNHRIQPWHHPHEAIW